MNIAIAGYGAEGRSSYEYYTDRGHHVSILDERDHLDDIPPEAQAITGAKAFDSLDAFDLVVRTPSLAPSKLEGARQIWSATNEFFKECPAPIIGVTGTKGKGTTSSLIASILDKAGKTVHLVGNIGKPALDILPSITKNDIVVYELSSFQLWDIQFSPHIAVVLMIEPDHLDVHEGFEDYVAAKRNIVRYQTGDDTVVFAVNNSYAAIIASRSEAHKIAVQSEETVHVDDGFFWYGTQKVCSSSSLKLRGVHNQDNACAAIAAVWKFVSDPAHIADGLANFEGLPHRLKFVRDAEGVSYYDDSIATTIGSAIAAIHAFERPKILILGGSSKGTIDFSQLAAQAVTGNVKMVLAIGDQGEVIRDAMLDADVAVEYLGTHVSMADIVGRAHELARPGDVVILSPACASFGMFKNYADRGDQFVAAANAL